MSSSKSASFFRRRASSIKGSLPYAIPLGDLGANILNQSQSLTSARQSGRPEQSGVSNQNSSGSNSSPSSTDPMQGRLWGPTGRSRILKTAGLVFLLVCAFLWLRTGTEAGASVAENKQVGSSLASQTLTTPRCSKSVSPNKPLVQYAIVIDAGSTGSRIHVYKFNNCFSSPELEDEEFAQVAPRKGGAGLSAYGADPEAAAQSLDELLDVAMRTVPQEVQSCTPVTVKATAGLRKLGPGPSDAILKAVRHRLETKYPFPVISEERGGVEVMEGTDEGVYAWVTVNYLLNKIGSGLQNDHSAAVFDLGGGSTQIVFEPNVIEGQPTKLADGEHKYLLDYGGKQFTLYQHSYLGYGLMAARNNLHRHVVENVHADKVSAGVSNHAAWLSLPIINPCLNPGSSQSIEVELSANHPLGASVHVTMKGPSELASEGANTVQCLGLLERTLSKDSPCPLEPCSFQGVHQPSLEATLAHSDIYLFSYFYDRTFPLGMPTSFTLRDLRAVTGQVCAGEKSGAWEIFGSFSGAVDELKGRPEACLDLSYMFTLLHSGYGMPLEREVKIAKKLQNKELGWCLGASLPMLSTESGWQCRIKEVF